MRERANAPTISVALLATAAAAAAAAAMGACARPQPGTDGSPGSDAGGGADASDGAPPGPDASGADAGDGATTSSDACAAGAADAGVAAGAELAVAVTTVGVQSRPRVAVAADGSFAVVWEGDDGLGRGVRARCFDASGVPAGGEVALNTSTLGDQTRPAVAVSASTAVVLVAWADTGGASDEVRYKMLAAPAAGCGATSASDLQLASTVTGDQGEPALAALPGGGFVATWRDTSAVAPAVRARWLDDLGNAIGNDFAVSETAGSAVRAPAVATFGGGVAFAWEGDDAAGSGVVLRAFAGGATTGLGPEVIVNGATAGDQMRPALAMRPADGSLALVWSSDPAAGGGAPDLAGVLVKRYDATLTPTDTAALVLDTGIDGTCDETGPPALDGCARGAVGGSAAGTWLAVWPASATCTEDGSGSGLRGRRFDGATFLDLADFQVNGVASGDQHHPDVAGRADGTFVVVWAGAPASTPADVDVWARIVGP